MSHNIRSDEGKYARAPGDKCHRGHLRNVLADGRCRDCLRENAAKYRASASEVIREKGRQYQRNNRWRKFGLTEVQYRALAAEYAGMCAICQEEPPTLCIDHNHATGKVRGLLCDNCNKGVGFFRDSRELLLRAAMYLREHDGE